MLLALPCSVALLVFPTALISVLFSPRPRSTRSRCGNRPAP